MKHNSLFKDTVKLGAGLAIGWGVGTLMYNVIENHIEKGCRKFLSTMADKAPYESMRNEAQKYCDKLDIDYEGKEEEPTDHKIGFIK